jgi:hypothetical protein
LGYLRGPFEIQNGDATVKLQLSHKSHLSEHSTSSRCVFCTA